MVKTIDIEFLSKLMKEQFVSMMNTGALFKSALSGAKIWELYLSNLEDDPVFRDPESSTHNCNNCHNFIRRYGNVVAINSNGEIMTLFDIGDIGEYQASFDKISSQLNESPIANVFFESFYMLDRALNYSKVSKRDSYFQLGVAHNKKRYTREEAEKFGVVKPNEIKTFNHFNVKLHKNFVLFGNDSTESVLGIYKAKYDVLYRGLEEIDIDTLDLVVSLINQKSLLNGEQYLSLVQQFKNLKVEFDLCEYDKKLFTWKKSYNLSEGLAKFRNTLVGTLCIDILTENNLEKACLDWNKRADPVNYMKATAPITQKQINEAEKFVVKNNYQDSFDRRFATLSDIHISEILHINADKDSSIKNVSVFSNVKPTNKSEVKIPSNIAEISSKDFFLNLLPTISNLELLVENTHKDNFVALTTSVKDGSKNIFKWDNNYSWTYLNNLAGKSFIKDAVQSRGGKTDVDVRISIHFPDTTDDYDLHLIEPNGGKHIYYQNRRQLSRFGGMLDLDAQGCDGHFPPEKRVENITYKSKSSMIDGTYKIYVNNYSGGGVHTKFNIEVEIDGETTTCKLLEPLTTDATIGSLIVSKGQITFHPYLKHMAVLESVSNSTNIWNIDTKQFHSVNMVCLSPNYWGENEIGNKHVMFMLQDCVPDIPLRSFHNENLNSELLKHRKVIEVLGSKSLIEPFEGQLAGLGFNTTVNSSIIARYKVNKANKLIKINI